MGLTKGQPGDLHQYFCRVLEQNRLLVFRRCPVGGVLGGRQLEARTRYAMSEVFETIQRRRRAGGLSHRRSAGAACEIIAGAAVEGTQQHAEQIKLVNVYCKCGLFLDVGVSPARRGTPHSTE